MRRPDGISEFRLAAHVANVSERVLSALLKADEKSEIEPALSTIIGHVDETPHGPTEIADLLTIHLSVLDQPVFAAIAIKGKAWPRVRSRDVAHQLMRAAQVPQVDLLVLAAVGDVQDDVKRDLAFLADRTPCDWMILDRRDLARIFIAYGRLCPVDGTWLNEPSCPTCDYLFAAPPVSTAGANTAVGYALLSLEDVSYAGARRYSTHILVPQGLGREAVERLVGVAIQSVRHSGYSRNEAVERAHGNRPADVVFLYVYEDVTQRPFANWIARSIWISSTLPERFRPIPFGVKTAESQLWIDWNESYAATRTYMAGHTSEKAPYLRDLDVFMSGASAIADTAGRLLQQGDAGSVDEGGLRRLERRADALPRPDPMLAAPFELSELDSIFGQAEASLGNLFLPFSSRGLATWPEPDRRLWLARDALRHLVDALARLHYERGKIR